MKNRLLQEKSPYLIAHGNNPVDWYPWGNEALTKAKNENKPIFLSIGYFTCHWCHVMEKESFESQEVANLLNKYFVSIKVDKEERPDIDSIYMNVCQMLTGNGGWPLNLFLLPDQKPFFAGTYFPKHTRYGQKGFIELLENVIELWTNDKKKIVDSSNNIFHKLNVISSVKSDGEVDKSIAHKTFALYKEIFDYEYGGIKGAPKFPMPQYINFLLKYGYLYNNSEAVSMAQTTLLSLYKGGIYDHIGNGFCRYATDDKWLIPHFEKMLYDNSLLIISYADLFMSTKNIVFKEIAENIIAYVLRVLKDPNGGFYTSEDADSGGKEGAFYLWTYDEVIKALGIGSNDRFCKTYNITPRGNFEGKNILNKTENSEINISDGDKVSLNKLFLEREKRVKPAIDTKILLDQNAMFIKALSYCGRIFENKEYIKIAEETILFILNNFLGKNDILIRYYKNGQSKAVAYADDYVFFIECLITTYEATGNDFYLYKAKFFNSELIEYFWDDDNAGLFQTSKNSESLIKRQKIFLDSAVPSCNGVCINNFSKLSFLLFDESLVTKAYQILKIASYDLNNNPLNYISLITEFMDIDSGSPEIIISIGNDNHELMDYIKKCYLPLSTLKYEDEDLDVTTVHICESFSCKPPITTIEEFKEILNIN